MSDKITVYPLVKQSDWIYTKCNIKPNQITLFNNLVITPFMMYNLYYDRSLLECVLFFINSLGRVRKFKPIVIELPQNSHVNICLNSQTILAGFNVINQ